MCVCVWGTKDGRLGDRRDGGNRRGRHGLGVIIIHVHLGGLNLVIRAGPLGAVTRDVAGLTALVARLAGRVERPTVRGGAVARDVAELAASIALHRLRLAVASEVVRATALVARRRTRAGESAPPGAEAATTDDPTSADTGNRGVGAVTLKQRQLVPCRIHLPMMGRKTHSQVAHGIAVVASVAGAGAAQAESRALGLNVPETLAVIALLRLCGARHRALVRFVVRLLACRSGSEHIHSYMPTT